MLRDLDYRFVAAALMSGTVLMLLADGAGRVALAAAMTMVRVGLLLLSVL